VDYQHNDVTADTFSVIASGFELRSDEMHLSQRQVSYTRDKSEAAATIRIRRKCQQEDLHTSEFGILWSGPRK